MLRNSLRILLMIIGVGGTVPALAASPLDTVPIDVSAYANIRADLMKFGMKPRRSTERTAGDCRDGWAAVCARFPEADSCGGSGIPRCVFVLHGRGTRVTIQMRGETMLILDAVEWDK